MPWRRPEESTVQTVSSADSAILVQLPGVSNGNFPAVCRVAFNAANTERIRAVVCTQNDLTSPPVAVPENSDGVLIETELDDFGMIIVGSAPTYINTEGHTHLAFTASTASGTPEVSITRMS